MNCRSRRAATPARALLAGGLAAACSPAARTVEGVAPARGGAPDAELVFGNETAPVWREASARGATPEEFAQACDDWAGRLLDAGDPGGAAGVLQRCREQLGPLVDADDPRAAGLASYLARMRSLERLRRAVAASEASPRQAQAPIP